MRSTTTAFTGGGTDANSWSAPSGTGPVDRGLSSTRRDQEERDYRDELHDVKILCSGDWYVQNVVVDVDE